MLISVKEMVSFHIWPQAKNIWLNKGTQNFKVPARSLFSGQLNDTFPESSVEHPSLPDKMHFPTLNFSMV